MRLILALCALLTAGTLAADRPNILFIFSDDHALNAISAYGGRFKDIAPTPNIDRLAKEGALFTRSYCANSLCGPSRACVLTGKHSAVNGFIDNAKSVFDGGQVTFPKLLQQGGYQTAIIGKWHLVSQPTGFDHWEILPGQGSYYNPDFLTAAGNHREQGYVTDLITDKTIDWLKNRDKTKPFMLMCQHKAPHRNWSPAPRHYRIFEGVKFPEPESLFDRYEHRDAALGKQQMSIARNFTWGSDMKLQGPNLFPAHFTGEAGMDEYDRMDGAQKKAWDDAYEPENQRAIEAMKSGKWTDEDFTRWKYQRYMHDYLSTVRSVDESVGRLLDELGREGLAKNTIVIYSADQGFYLGEHGWFDKRWIFEESLSMPFLIRWPDVVKAGTKSQALIQNIDYAPTFLEAAGVSVPQEIQGRSLVSVLKNEGTAPADWRDAIYYFYSGERMHAVAAHDGIRTDRYKLAYFPNSKTWNLFDLAKDPAEMNSVHDNPAYADVFEKLKAKLDIMREESKGGKKPLNAPKE